jgi:hypothetical protein
MKKINYLNNKDLLEEIHKSKNSYCSYLKDEHHRYDAIVYSLEKINVRTIAEAKRVRAKRLSVEEFERRKAIDPKVKLSECEVDYKKIQKEDLVFRVMTYDHIPNEPGRKKNPKSSADSKIKVNFPAFQHWKYDEKDNLSCVGKSHWEGGMHNGKFNKEGGKPTAKLAMMWMKLCETIPLSCLFERTQSKPSGLGFADGYQRPSD